MDLDNVPTIRGNEGVLAYCHELGAVGIKPWRVRMAVTDREIVPHLIGSQNWFSRNAVHKWLDSLQQPEPSRFVGVNADRNPKVVAQP
jgi:hypothetical protein